MSSERGLPPDPPAYCLVLDRKQLCLLYAITYTGGHPGGSLSDPLAALVLGRPPPTPQSDTVHARLDAQRAVLTEYPELDVLFRATAPLRHKVPDGF